MHKDAFSSENNILRKNSRGPIVAVFFEELSSWGRRDRPVPESHPQQSPLHHLPPSRHHSPFKPLDPSNLWSAHFIPVKRFLYLSKYEEIKS